MEIHEQVEVPKRCRFGHGHFWIQRAFTHTYDCHVCGAVDTREEKLSGQHEQDKLFTAPQTTPGQMVLPS